MGSSCCAVVPQAAQHPPYTAPGTHDLLREPVRTALPNTAQAELRSWAGTSHPAGKRHGKGQRRELRMVTCSWLVWPKAQLKLPHEKTAGKRAKPPSLAPAGPMETTGSVEPDVWECHCRLGALRSDRNALQSNWLVHMFSLRKTQESIPFAWE